MAQYTDVRTVAETFDPERNYLVGVSEKLAWRYVPRNLQIYTPRRLSVGVSKKTWWFLKENFWPVVV